MQPKRFRPETPDDLIGPAAQICRAILAAAGRDGDAPVLALFTGDPGTGKSSAAGIIAHRLASHPTMIEHLNGKDVNADRVRAWKGRFGYGSLFGGHTVLWLDEIDQATPAAQVDMLTLLDTLPPNWAVLATTNVPVDRLEERFQTRFQHWEVTAPKSPEIAGLLERWPEIPVSTSRKIAELAAGNVRAALLDLQSALDYRLAA